MLYDYKPRFDNLPQKLEMDYSRILNKPYFVKNVTWRDTDILNKKLGSFNIPGDILINELAKIPFKASVYYRAKVKAIVQVSGTPMHQGCVIASALPAGFPNYVRKEYIRNTLMCCPHVFLLANEATPGEVEIPFYVQGKLAAIDLVGTTVSPVTKSDDYATLSFYVWNTLAAPTSGSSTLSISIHFMFTDLEFYVPHVDVQWDVFQGQGFVESLASAGSRAIDGIFSVGRRFTGDFLDSLRSGIKSWTGLHSPEHAALANRSAVQYRQNLNLVDTPNYYEKLDPYADFTHIVNDYTFDSNIDEMSLAYILKKPQFIGSFKVATADITGTLLWSRPITPIQEVADVTYESENFTRELSNVHTNLIQTLAYMSKYWKGGMKIHIQAVMTNFHYCRLIVARDYSPDTNMLNSTPNYTSVSNLLTETLEFSAGGQIQTIEMPFCSPLNQLPCSSDFVFNALQHGMYYIYLYQPLVANGSVPLNVSFNVYLTCDNDFDFFGYAVQPLITADAYLESPVTARSKTDLDPIFEAQAATTVNVSDQTAITNQGETDDQDTIYDMRPIKTIRDYTRRLIKVFSTNVADADFTLGNGCFTFPIAQLLGFEPTLVANSGDFYHDTPTSHILARLFLGYTGGAKIKMVINGSTISEVWYVPPSYCLGDTKNYWIGTEPLPSTSDITYDPMNQMFAFPGRFAPTTTLSPFYSVQTVGSERPNYVNSQSGYRMKSQTNGIYIGMATSITEVVVPYMSPYRFVGDYSKWSCTNSPELVKIATHDMGNLVVKIGAPVKSTGVTPELLEDISIELFVGITDEGRFGYQIAAPPVVLPAFKVGLDPTAEYVQLNPAYNVSTSQLPYSTVTSSVLSPGLYNIRSCYYAKN